MLLLSNPVSAGYTQNPISVYYCYDQADELVVAIAEVRAGRAFLSASRTVVVAMTAVCLLGRWCLLLTTCSQSAQQARLDKHLTCHRMTLCVRPAACVRQVTNTPWGERVTFCFAPQGSTTRKAMHVSPFQDMDNTW